MDFRKFGWLVVLASTVPLLFSAYSYLQTRWVSRWEESKAITAQIEGNPLPKMRYVAWRSEVESNARLALIVGCIGVGLGLATAMSANSKNDQGAAR